MKVIFETSGRKITYEGVTSVYYQENKRRWVITLGNFSEYIGNEWHLIHASIEEKDLKDED